VAGLLLVCLTASLARPVAADQGTFYEMTTGISNVVTQADRPYVELQYLHFRAEFYNETPFEWFWLGSSDLMWLAQSLNQTITFSNGRVDRFQVANISLSWPEGQSLRWQLFRVDDYTYSFGIIVAFPINVTFPMVFVSTTIVTRELEDQWTHREACERLTSPPSNDTLRQWGLNPNSFWRSNGPRTNEGGEYKTYYLYEVSLSKPSSFQERVGLTYTVPAILLLAVIVVSIGLLIRGRLRPQDSLTLYLGTAFFCLPFLVSYAQFGLGPVTTTELLFYVDIYLSAGLTLASLLVLGVRKGQKKEL
jgi:hypothetical protein